MSVRNSMKGFVGSIHLFLTLIDVKSLQLAQLQRKTIEILPEISLRDYGRINWMGFIPVLRGHLLTSQFGMMGILSGEGLRTRKKQAGWH